MVYVKVNGFDEEIVEKFILTVVIILHTREFLYLGKKVQR